MEDPLTLFIENGTATQSGILSGPGSVTKTGAGGLTITGDNTYEGGTFLQAGTLWTTASDSLGIGDVTIQSGTLGSAVTAGFINKFFVTGDFTIAVQGDGTILDFFSNVDMGSSNTVTFTGDGIACFEGGVSGNNISFLTGGNPAVVTFCSDVSNTFTGTLHLSADMHLELWKIGNDFDPPVIVISGDLLVDEGGTVILITSDQFAPTSAVELNGLMTGGNVMNSISELNGASTGRSV